MDKILIVGLGNPGIRYHNNRHNAGSLFLDWIHDSEKAKEWTIHSRQFAKLSLGELSGHQVILAHPLEYMNESGKTVLILKNFYKIPLGNIIIIQDDTDLVFPTFKISFAKASAGHKGIESIVQAVGSNEFYRFRIGVRPKDNNASHRIKALNLVLQDFSDGEINILNHKFLLWSKEIKNIIGLIDSLK